MPFEWTLDGKKWVGVKYSTEEAFKARENAEIAFNELFCHVNTRKSYSSCLERSESDGHNEDGIEYAVGMYCLGGCVPKLDPIEIDLITDGNGLCGWMYHSEKYKKGLDPFRRFACEPIEEVKKG